MKHCLVQIMLASACRTTFAASLETRVGVIDGIAHVEEAAEQLAELEIARRPLTRPAATLSRWETCGVRVRLVEVFNRLLK